MTFMNRLRIRYRDWRRGYSYGDLASAVRKIRAAQVPGTALEVTRREMTAINANPWVLLIREKKIKP